MSTVVMSTTVVLILLPVASVILTALSKSEFGNSVKFKTVFVLSIAYSSSIGSAATLIGAPPNLLYAATVSEVFGHTVTFAEWSMLGSPLSASMLLLCGLFLTSKVGKFTTSTSTEIKNVLLVEKSKIAPITNEQKTVLG